MIRQFIILLPLLGFFAAPAYAAEIKCLETYGKLYSEAPIPPERLSEWFPSGRTPSPVTCTTISISGEIVAGDSQKFFDLLRQNHPFVDTVKLNSPGGEAFEAMTIGHWIRKYYLSTWAPYTLPKSVSMPVPGELPQVCEGKDCFCASSCFLIWAAGRVRIGDVLGVHRPTIRSEQFDNLPPDQAAEFYKKLLSRMHAYLNEMEIPEKYIQNMTDTESGSVYWTTKAEAETMLDVPSISESFSATCGGLTKEEKTILNNIKTTKVVDRIFEGETEVADAADRLSPGQYKRSTKQQLWQEMGGEGEWRESSPNDEYAEKALNEKAHKFSECMRKKIYNYRDGFKDAQE